MGLFALLLLLPYALRQTFSASFDTTFLIIIAMIAAAWYLGRGPGLLIAVLFEAVLIYFSTAPFTARSAVITFNRLLLFFGVVIFASARRKAEKILTDQRELLRVTLSSIGDAVIATDIDGKVTFMNPVAEELTGWTSAEAANRPLDEVFTLIGEKTRSAVDSPLAMIRRAGRVVGLANHTVLISRTGSEIPIEDSGAPIRDSNGKMIGAVIVFHDVTERREAERQREQLLLSERAARSEAETASRLKDDFLATVSHELRTPLNAILGWVAMLKNSEPDMDSIAKGLGVIERNARTQNELIGDILDVSRIVSGKLRIETGPVDLVTIVRGAVETVYPAAAAKSITVRTSFEADRTVVLGDPERLQQVMWNLLSNAVKFTPSGGEVNVRLSREADNILVSVQDTGAGISEEFLPVVFDRFRQIDSSMKREHGGLGLGLAIVRHLVELHGGTVAAESEGRGLGATFSVRIPLLAAVSGAEPQNREREGTSLRGIRVLVVDDHRDSLEMFCTALSYYGAEARAADSCRSALKMFQEWRPNVLVSDLGMPGEDGFDLIGKIRALSTDEGGDIPAAALTAYVREEDRRRAIEAGFNAHIPKPVDAETLAAAVADLAQTNGKTGG